MCSFSNGGQLFAAVGIGNVITVWSSGTHQVLASLKVSFSPGLEGDDASCDNDKQAARQHSSLLGS